MGNPWGAKLSRLIRERVYVSGTIERAGSPEPANDAPHDAFSVDEYLIDSPSRTAMLTVKGDSMIDAIKKPSGRL